MRLLSASAFLLLPLAALYGCAGAGLAVHQTPVLRDHAAAFNAAHSGALAAAHDTPTLLVGDEYTAWLLPDAALGLGVASTEASTEATHTSGATHRLTLRTSDVLVKSGYPLLGGREVDPYQRVRVYGHVDGYWRTTTAIVGQRGNAAAPEGTERFSGNALGVRPGLSLTARLFDAGPLSVSARVSAGYDLPILVNEPLSAGNVRYFAQTYAGSLPAGSSMTTEERETVKANLTGFSGGVGVSFALRLPGSF